MQDLGVFTKTELKLPYAPSVCAGFRRVEVKNSAVWVHWMASLFLAVLPAFAFIRFGKQPAFRNSRPLFRSSFSFAAVRFSSRLRLGVFSYARRYSYYFVACFFYPPSVSRCVSSFFFSVHCGGFCGELNARIWIDGVRVALDDGTELKNILHSLLPFLGCHAAFLL